MTARALLEAELPELPKAYLRSPDVATWTHKDVYTADQMRAYAREAIASSLEEQVAPMWGGMIEADFEKNTITFEMRGDYVAAAGLYEIRPARTAQSEDKPA